MELPDTPNNPRKLLLKLFGIYLRTAVPLTRD